MPYPPCQDGVRLLTSPRLPAKAKKGLLSDIGEAAGVAPTLVHFLWVVCDNGQLHHLIRILDAAEGTLADASGELRATVTSAAALHPGEQLVIAKKLQELSGCRDVRLKLKIDPKLLGGFVVRYNSRSIDCSGRTMGWPVWRGVFTRRRGRRQGIYQNRRLLDT